MAPCSDRNIPFRPGHVRIIAHRSSSDKNSIDDRIDLLDSPVVVMDHDLETQARRQTFVPIANMINLHAARLNGPLDPRQKSAR